MKRIYMFLCVLFAMNALVADMARIEALVVDEITGEPLRGVEVTGNFSMNHGLLAVKGSPGPNIQKVRPSRLGRLLNLDMCKIICAGEAGTRHFVVRGIMIKDVASVSAYGHGETTKERLLRRTTARYTAT